MSETFDFMTVPGLTTRPELEFMQQCARRARVAAEVGEKYVELGTWKGRATIALCQALGSDRDVVTFDNFVMQHHGEHTMSKTEEIFGRADVRPLLLSRDSTSIPDAIRSVVFLLIDTDHRAAPLKRELDAWEPLLVNGGMVCLHDYNNPKWPEVTTFADRYFDPASWEKFGPVEMMVGYRKKKWAQSASERHSATTARPSLETTGSL